jgi:transposase InsO family protein
MTDPLQRRETLAHLTGKGLSQRAACRWSGLSRRVWHYRPQRSEQDQALLTYMRAVTQTHPRFGYRRVAVLAKTSFHRAWRLWKQHDFRLQPPRTRRHRLTPPDPRPHQAEHPNHVWTYDILHDQLADGSWFKTLSLLDEFTRECLVIKVGPSLRAPDVIETLTTAMQQHGPPEFLRSDNGSEFTALAVRQWLQLKAVGPSFIPPGRPWQNGYVESFHSRFRDECLNREWFLSHQEAAVVIEQWRQAYNTQRPHSALGYKTPAQVAAEYTT